MQKWWGGCCLHWIKDNCQRKSLCTYCVKKHKKVFSNPSFSSLLFRSSSSVSAVPSRDLIGHSRAPCDLRRELRKKIKMVENTKPQSASLFIPLYQSNGKEPPSQDGPLPQTCGAIPLGTKTPGRLDRCSGSQYPAESLCVC